MTAIRDLTDKELIEEWMKWDLKIREADRWKAAITIADDLRRACANEIDRRRVPE